MSTPQNKVEGWEKLDKETAEKMGLPISYGMVCEDTITHKEDKGV